MKKYALHSGAIISRNDDEFHHISAITLVNLYGLKQGDFIIWDRIRFMGRKWDDYIHLFPRDNGDYRL